MIGHERARTDQIHHGLLDHPGRGACRTDWSERAENAVMLWPAVEVSHEDRAAECRGRSQVPDACGRTEVFDDECTEAFFRVLAHGCLRSRTARCRHVEPQQYIVPVVRAWRE